MPLSSTTPNMKPGNSSTDCALLSPPGDCPLPPSVVLLLKLLLLKLLLLLPPSPLFPGLPLAERERWRLKSCLVGEGFLEPFREPCVVSLDDTDPPEPLRTPSDLCLARLREFRLCALFWGEVSGEMSGVERAMWVSASALPISSSISAYCASKFIISSVSFTFILGSHRTGPVEKEVGSDSVSRDARFSSALSMSAAARAERGGCELPVSTSQ
mmetsp:Transcript_3545/g.8902  ORF Transcript_3545/g.8902 Transcript_3545/m.8902 type:complete len:214 (+) Transcript_3545:2191-2832(+)